MIPFPGESLGVWSASDVGGIGEDLTDMVVYRTGSATLAAGSEWVAWIRVGWPDYLEDDTTPVVVSWVVEVLSGSVTVAVSESHQPSIDETDPTPTGLGAHTLTTGTNVVTSTFDAADTITGTGYLMLRMVASSGSATVQQVKMRVWPTAGVAGGWSDEYPPFERRPGASVLAAPERNLGATRSSPPGPVLPLWEEVKAEVQGHAGELYTSTLTGPGPVVGGQLVTDTFAFEGVVLDSEATWLLSLPFVHASRPSDLTPMADPDLPLVDGVDYIRPPEEVFGDEAATILASGAVAVSWDASTATVQTIHDEDGGGLIFVGVVPLTPGPDPLEVAFTWPDSSASAQDGDTLALPDTDELIFAATHSLMRDDVAPYAASDQWRFVVGNGLAVWDGVEDAFVGLRYIAAYPPYRLWSPTLVEVEVKYLRVIQRGDGYGMGSGRVLGSRTRQTSTRVIGSP